MGELHHSDEETREAIEAYFSALNHKDVEGLLSCLSEEVAHDINEGPRELGKEAFRRFKAHMDTCYDEVISDLVVMTHGTRGAAEFTCTGRYVARDGGLPPARGQKYVLTAAATFEVEGRKIVRISGYYNLRRFVEMVSAGGVD
jgi:steroid delta-isomerase-like uncharacterized protein